MRNRIQPWFAVLLVFMAIGFISRLYQSSSQSFIILLVLVAVILILYKFPPTKWRNPPRGGRNLKSRVKPDFRTAEKAERRRTSTFTVIEGRKNKDDEPPRYH